MRVAIYTRVSSAHKRHRGEEELFEQNPEVQGKPLRQLAQQRNWQVVMEESDRISSTKATRPGREAIMTAARRGEIDAVVVWRFDRFARSVKELVASLEEFQSLHVEFVSHQEALDTSTPMGKAMFTVIAAMAELERSVLKERVIAGQEHARLHGTKSGKAIGRPRRVFNRDQVAKLRAAGMSWPLIARKLGVGQATAWRACQKPVSMNGDQRLGKEALAERGKRRRKL